jgi:ComF family protein
MFGTSYYIVNQIRRMRLTGARALSRALAATLFPPRCGLCGFPGASLDLDLCEVCHADLPWATQVGVNDVMALRYEHPVDEMIRQLKYHREIAHARVFGVLLAEVVRAHAGALPKWLVPVPLHDARLRERGFNQALALARYAGRVLGIPCMRNAVKRLRNTPSQTALDVRERRDNVRGAFAVNGARALARLSAADHVAVVDDVITTGSTVNELRATLLAAGVSRVDVWAVAQAAPRALDTTATTTPR